MHENKLIHEKSPYLLQHAHNPVDWYPWGEEAFQKAAEEEKPVFLSIGYSTCHWCHVMERESFEDPEVAALLNRDFVAVKVDREERPEIDAVYMAVCQAVTGSGGWPLTILMTPEKKPFYAGTYLPKRKRYGTAGLMELLPEVARLWREDRERLLRAGEVIAAFAGKREEENAAQPEKELLQIAVRQYLSGFDPKNGGFGPAPKFPSAHNLLFLLRFSEIEGDEDARHMAQTTLRQMARGGLFDQIGGGFSRYSTDEKWLVPHFEKMLYDNALLAYSYLEAYRVTGESWYRTVAERTLLYVLRELTGPSEEFYCGQDADSEGVEGKYYVWSPREVEAILGKEDAETFCSWFDITDKGNFEGKSIPNLLKNPQYGDSYPGLEIASQKLYDYRLTRTRLHKDDKVLTSWNALVIAAFAKAYRVWGDSRYLTAAKEACRFLQENLTDPEGRLFVRWREGEAAHKGNLDDYAFYAWALLELYAADFSTEYLSEAVRIAQWMADLFFDDASGGFFLYASDAEALIGRPKELYDGALPSGNAVAALALERLARLTGEPRWRELADRQMAFLAGNIHQYPMGHGFALLALSEALYPSGELICVLPEGRVDDVLRELIEAHSLTALVKTEENAGRLAAAAPFTGQYPLPKTGEAYYLCRNGACSAPVFSLKELKKSLRSKQA